jgi:hypothetical protein
MYFGNSSPTCLQAIGSKLPKGGFLYAEHLFLNLFWQFLFLYFPYKIHFMKYANRFCMAPTFCMSFKILCQNEANILNFDGVSFSLIPFEISCLHFASKFDLASSYGFLDKKGQREEKKTNS